MAKGRRHGWRPNLAFDADGAGTTSFAIWRPGVLCQVSIELPGGTDNDAQVNAANAERIEVQCYNARPEDAPV